MLWSNIIFLCYITSIRFIDTLYQRSVVKCNITVPNKFVQLYIFGQNRQKHVKYCYSAQYILFSQSNMYIVKCLYLPRVNIWHAFILVVNTNNHIAISAHAPTKIMASPQGQPTEPLRLPSTMDGRWSGSRPLARSPERAQHIDSNDLRKKNHI